MSHLTADQILTLTFVVATMAVASIFMAGRLALGMEGLPALDLGAMRSHATSSIAAARRLARGAC